MELLAPAGDKAALMAALEAGTDAVYLGLTALNARRRARNFTQNEFVEAVDAVHRHGAKAYLTLNTDLSEREVGLAARILELAASARVDAVLVRDPALFLFREHYPELEFHFSTQTAVANRADVEAAGRWGANRVVLAREMTLEEIAAASAVEGVATEVFVQGALCFSVSGRCLLSSWAGGRSGNRGSCTSPCRVPWTVDGQPAGTPLAMHDLAAVDRLGELERAGVTAIKIEGRMKTAAWVRQAVSLYRRALAAGDGSADLAQLRREAADLAAYSGRQTTSGYLDGQREAMTAVAARPSRPTEAAADDGADDSAADDNAPQSDLKSYRLELELAPRGIVARVVYAGEEAEWTIPKTVVRRPHKAVSIGQLFAYLEVETVQGCQLGETATNDPDFMLVPRAVNALIARIAKIIQQGQKRRDQIAHVAVRPAVRQLLDRQAPHPANRVPLGGDPDRVRLDARRAADFLSAIQPRTTIVEGLTAESLAELRSSFRKLPLVAALPPVCFEDRFDEIEQLIRACARMGVVVEANSLGGWRRAADLGAKVECGPYLGVLNSLAAAAWGTTRVQLVSFSLEADRRQLEELSAYCPLPASLVVFGRPPLLITRSEVAADHAAATFEDRREVRMRPRRERGLWVFRPEEPFDLRGVDNDRIRVAHLVVDLVGSPDPVGEWMSDPYRHGTPFRFNYDRSLA